MKRRWADLTDWLDHRTGVQTAVRQFLYEEIPASSGWHQVFGSVAVFLFLVQAFTGALLAFNYAPTPGDAYNVIAGLNEGEHLVINAPREIADGGRVTEKPR